MEWFFLLTNPVVIECIRREIPITIEKGVLKIHGFYKSDTVELVLNDGNLLAISRYERIDNISKFYDLVALNYYWWKCSKNKHPDWRFPNRNWINPLKEYDFISVTIDEVTTIKELK